jgi:putative transposase
VDTNEVKFVNEPINEFIGLDLGIKDFIVTSENQVFENIKLTRSNQMKIAKLHKQLSKKQKGSKNRDKARLKLAKLHEKLNNKKEDYLHKVTNQLINENQVIIIEDLNVKGMLQNHNLAKSIQELSLYRFKEMLRYKCLWFGRDLVEIDRFHPSSKLCNVCGYKNTELTLKDRDWCCSECGTTHNRDLNAAINIKNEGLRLYKQKYPSVAGN